MAIVASEGKLIYDRGIVRFTDWHFKGATPVAVDPAPQDDCFIAMLRHIEQQYREGKLRFLGFETLEKQQG